jgi:hypothetical protein
MLTRLEQSLLFRLEQMVMRGALARLAVLLAMVAWRSTRAETNAWIWPSATS